MEKNNIFEGAKFGDKFLTASGKIARFICVNYTTDDKPLVCMYIEDERAPYFLHTLSGNAAINEELNIVSKYTEPIDEERLFDMIDKEYESEYGNGEYCHKQSFSWGFQEGYRKAKEE